MTTANSAIPIPTADYRKIPTGVQINAFGNRYWRVVECTSSEMSSSLLLHALNCGGELSLEQFGQWCDEHYQQPFLLGDRAILPSEMGAIVNYKSAARFERAQTEGCCCDEGPEARGCRHGIPECPILEAARKLVFRTWRE